MKYFLILVVLVCSVVIIFTLKSKKSAEVTFTNEPVLELYIFGSCPYCVNVLNFLDQNNLHVVIKDAKEPENAKFLMEHGKKRQVPCLFIDNQPLYESKDIIHYLSETVKKDKSL
jgi:glutaredoxin